MKGKIDFKFKNLNLMKRDSSANDLESATALTE